MSSVPNNILLNIHLKRDDPVQMIWIDLASEQNEYIALERMHFRHACAKLPPPLNAIILSLSLENQKQTSMIYLEENSKYNNI